MGKVIKPSLVTCKRALLGKGTVTNNKDGFRTPKVQFREAVTDEGEKGSRSEEFLTSTMEISKSMPTLKRSKSIPILNPIRRTPSENQLREEEAAAEYRDHCMYVRLVNGLNKKKEKAFREQGMNSYHSTVESLMNIVRTHQSNVLELDPYHHDHHRIGVGELQQQQHHAYGNNPPHHHQQHHEDKYTVSPTSTPIATKTTAQYGDSSFLPFYNVIDTIEDIEEEGMFFLEL